LKPAPACRARGQTRVLPIAGARITFLFAVLIFHPPLWKNYFISGRNRCRYHKFQENFAKTVCKNRLTLFSQFDTLKLLCFLTLYLYPAVGGVKASLKTRFAFQPFFAV
jgi:hypothetical protein